MERAATTGIVGPDPVAIVKEHLRQGFPQHHGNALARFGPADRRGRDDETSLPRLCRLPAGELSQAGRTPSSVETHPMNKNTKRRPTLPMLVADTYPNVNPKNKMGEGNYPPPKTP